MKATLCARFNIPFAARYEDLSVFEVSVLAEMLAEERKEHARVMEQLG